MVGRGWPMTVAVIQILYPAGAESRDFYLILHISVSLNDMNTTENLADKKIAVLLSGGVDSSVVVYELAQKGLTPDCFYIKIGPEEESEWDCTSEEDLEMATAVASRYGCRLEVVDCHRE